MSTCVICQVEYAPVHSLQCTCGSIECKHLNKLAKAKEWKHSTGRQKDKNWWTPEEEAFITANRFMPTSEMADIFNRPLSSVKDKRVAMKMFPLAICESCGNSFKKINMHALCTDCYPQQLEHTGNHRDSIAGRWQMYKANAIKRNISFEITLSDFSKYWKQPCEYCGTAIELIGLDRIDSNKGYIMDNLVSCCSRCNEMKNDRTVDQWMADMQRVLNHQGATA